MKIIVDKHEYAELVRACVKHRDRHSIRSNCFLDELCEGHVFMEEMCEIVEDEGDGNLVVN